MGKKDAILKSAAALFALQGFDATTTQQISVEAGATEPLIYYHFKGKDDLFAQIVKISFNIYDSRFDALKNTKTTSQFSKIEQLINLHCEIVEEMPSESYLIFNDIPDLLKDPANYCAEAIGSHRKLLVDYLSSCLKKGMKTGEFVKVPIKETAGLIVVLIYGLMRQDEMGIEYVKSLRAEAVDFCRRSLLAEK
jgi:AcrR family transcriptional regulator